MTARLDMEEVNLAIYVLRYQGYLTGPHYCGSLNVPSNTKGVSMMYHTIEQVAATLQVPEAEVRTLIRDGKLPVMVIGKNIRIPDYSFQSLKTTTDVKLPKVKGPAKPPTPAQLKAREAFGVQARKRAAEAKAKKNPVKSPVKVQGPPVSSPPKNNAVAAKV